MKVENMLRNKIRNKMSVEVEDGKYLHMYIHHNTCAVFPLRETFEGS